MPKTSIYLREIPPEVKQDFKAWCASQGTTMQAALIQLMRDVVQRTGRDVRRTTRSA